MRSLRLALGVGLALIGGGAMAEAPGNSPVFNARTSITWDPSTSVWTGALPAQRCSARAVRAASLAPVRHAEVIAEFRTPSMTPLLMAGAQACAAEAADAAGASALLTAAEAPFQTFRGTFTACLLRQGQAKPIGGLRLWVDIGCDF